MPPACRAIPKDVPTAPTVRARPGVVALQPFTITVVTPMFGGGAKARTPDPKLPVRGGSVRGQLRFWWRATRGIRFGTVGELRAREAQVWGDTDTPSPVWVTIRNAKFPAPKPCASWDRTPDGRNRLNWKDDFAKSLGQSPPPLPYVAFPFQGTAPGRPNSESPAAYTPAGGTFELHVTAPADLVPEVEAAVWAWVNFGGLGARTRRGCGALFCPAVSPSGAVDQWFRQRAQKYGIDPKTTRDWPTLGERVFVRDRAEPVLAAWQYPIDEYRHVRQGATFGRNPGQNRNRPGRSRWPEPETIRTATRQRFPQHARDPQMPDQAVPRAALGLPIVTHFAPGQGGTGPANDPRDTNLVPVVGGVVMDRWASPLVLKPLAVSPTTAYPLVLALNGPRVQHAALVAGDRDRPLATFGPAAIRHPSLATYPNTPLDGAPQTGDALDAVVEQLTGTPNGCRRRLS